ncbi:MAG: OmpA family protein [Candidatus Hydrogenedentes bacterium]|nr:OmpA family protein [Candidatus Hydrogenedentota bacterium]
MMHRRWTAVLHVVWLLPAVLAACSSAPDASAAAQEALTREKLLQMLAPPPVITRDGGERKAVIRPKVTSDGYAVPEASPCASLSTILFKLDSAELQPESVEQLNLVTAALNEAGMKDKRVLVEGHTCELGTGAHNKTLSEQRAASVRRFLAAHGVDDARLDTAGWGETRPRFGGEENRHLNRRVDFVMLESMSGKTREPLARGLRRLAAPAPGERRFLDVAFTGRRKAGGRDFPLDQPRNELQSGDFYGIEFSVFEGCHVYVLHLESQGTVIWPLVQFRQLEGVWYYFAETQKLPPDKTMYFLDEYPGTEVLAVIAAPGPLADAAAAAALFKQHGAGITEQHVRTALGQPEAELYLTVIDHK